MAQLTKYRYFSQNNVIKSGKIEYYGDKSVICRWRRLPWLTRAILRIADVYL